MAEHVANGERIEEDYVNAREGVTRMLQKAHAIKASILSYELKLARACNEFEQELKTIEGNFSAISEGR
jgi:septation ring formation regulator EzrA